MKKYVVYRIRTEFGHQKPEPMTAEEVQAWYTELANWGRGVSAAYDPEPAEYETYEEARACFDEQQPSSYWEPSCGGKSYLEVEFYELFEEVYDDDGEFEYGNIVDSKFAAARV